VKGVSGRTALGRWWGVLALAGAAVLLGLGEDAVRAWGRYEREAIAAGELWRLVFGHLVHLGWGHLWLNLAALGLMGALFEGLLAPRAWLMTSAWSAAAIDVGLYLWHSDVDWYVGLSGVLHGLMVAGAWRLARAPSPLGWALLAGVAAKLLWEQAAGPLPLSEATSGGPVVIEAHLYGAIGGLIAVIFDYAAHRSSRLSL
jgi:rhomboid family GlyGly-CTERM serine protease